MPASSMTGFATISGSRSGLAWTWDLKSVNGRGLDARLRIPPGYESIERPARSEVGKYVSRGNITASLTISNEAQVPILKINEDLLVPLLEKSRTLSDRFGADPASMDGLLSLKGVVEFVNGDDLSDDDRLAVDRAVIESFVEALASLKEERDREGREISVLLLSRLDEMSDILADLEAHPSRTPEAIQSRLAAQVTALMDSGFELDESRLHQEAVMLATKADIREELDRLSTHVQAARTLLSLSEPIGRKLDFLAQEFNRETNTICSKSNDIGVTALGLRLKAAIDQFREQVQNVE